MASSFEYIDAITLAPGLTPNSTADQTALIQQAITAATALGAGVYFPAGVYMYSGKITITCSLLGDGNFQTQMQYTTANGINAFYLCTGFP